LPYYNLFFRDTFGLSDAVIGRIYTLGSLAMLTITLAVPLTARRLGQVGALTAAMVATGISYIFLGLPLGLAPAVVFYMLSLGLRNTMTPFYSPLLLDRVEEQHHGVTSSISTAAWSLGFLVITFFSGGWVEAYGYLFLFQMTALSTLITAALVWMIFRALRPVEIAVMPTPRPESV
jgi:predicted MFS family arabinose efflux permease